MEKFDDEDFIQYSDEKVKDEKSRLSAFLFVHITLYILLIFFAIFFIWYTVFIATHNYYAVLGASMKDTLNVGISLTSSDDCEDGVYVDKTSDPELFDIIVSSHYSAKKGKDITIVKRLMATAGDYVSVALYDDGEDEYLYFYRIAKGTDLENFTDEQARVVENGENGYSVQSYDEWTRTHIHKVSDGNGALTHFTYNGIVYDDDFYSTFINNVYYEGADGYFVSNSGMIYVEVPENYYFCMGDNRAYSEDCRENGFYETSKIVGKVFIIVRNQGFVTRLWAVVKYYFAQVEDFFAR